MNDTEYVALVDTDRDELRERIGRCDGSGSID